jgi:hypothetical protein
MSWLEAKPEVIGGNCTFSEDMGLVNETVCTVMIYLNTRPLSLHCYSLWTIDSLYFPVGIYFWIRKET